MTLSRLVEAIPPPAEPRGTFDGPWSGVEAAIGTALPRDYKDLLRTYGRGIFFDFVRLYYPKHRKRFARLEAAVHDARVILSEPEDRPYGLWPEAGGLIPFGNTINADMLFWLPVGDPDDWSVVVWDRGYCRFEALDCDMTDFLAGLATGDVQPKAFRLDLMVDDVLFRPYEDAPAGAAASGEMLEVSWRLGNFGAEAVGVSRLLLRGEN